MDKIIVFGDCMLDNYVSVECSRLSPEAPVPVGLFKSEKFYLGGAANVAMNLARFNIPVDLYGIIGNDKFGKIFNSKLVEHKIKNKCYKDDKSETIVKKRFISSCNSQQLLRIDYEKKSFQENSLKLFNLMIKDIKKLKNQKIILIVSDYDKGTTEKFNTKTFREKTNQSIVIVDPKRYNPNLFQNAYLVKPNKKEYISIFKSQLSERSSQKIGNYQFDNKKITGIENLLITEGSDGMTLIENINNPRAAKIEQFRTKSKKIFDVTGAGDAVLATLSYCIFNRQPLNKSVHLSNLAGEDVVQRAGTSLISNDFVRKCETIINNQNHIEKTIFTNGCFDLLHSGHIEIFRKAKALGTKLIVGLNSDKSVKLLKGNDRPINDIQTRLKILESIKYIDEVRIFEEETPIELIKEIKPSIIVKGGDYHPDQVVGAEFIKSYGGKVVIIELLKNKSTTAIIKKIKKFQ